MILSVVYLLVRSVLGGGEQRNLAGLGHTAACPATRCLAEHEANLCARLDDVYLTNARFHDVDLTNAGPRR